jgi:hypothetical protein
MAVVGLGHGQKAFESVSPLPNLSTFRLPWAIHLSSVVSVSPVVAHWQQEWRQESQPIIKAQINPPCMSCTGVAGHHTVANFVTYPKYAAAGACQQHASMCIVTRWYGTVHDSVLLPPVLPRSRCL